MNPFHDFERRVDRLLRDLFGGKAEPSRGKELVEVQRAILDLIDERVQTLPRARRVFPFNDVAVRIPLPDAERRAAFEMVFVSDDALEHAVIEQLDREGVEHPPDLRVRVSLVETTEVTEPSIVCTMHEEEASEPVHAGKIRFTLPSGETLEVARPRVQVGRYGEVLDDRRRLVRRNDVVVDHDTVSRAHAHIHFDAGQYRLFDDGSTYGTSVIHEGRLVDVPKAGARGMRLHSGDEIYFGQSRVRFEVIE